MMLLCIFEYSAKSAKIQIKYLMTTFLSVLFSNLLLSNKGLESHDSPDVVDADINNFSRRSICLACFCSLQAVRNSAEANPANPSTMRPMPINACHGRRYFCTIQSTMTDVGIPSIVPTLQHYYIQHGKFSVIIPQMHTDLTISRQFVKGNIQ